MNPTEQVRAVLESIGWLDRKAGEIVEYRDYRKSPGGDFFFERVRFPDGSVRPCHRFHIPDLLHSLDACHEVFEKDAPDSYWMKLASLVCDYYSPGLLMSDVIFTCKPTCAQRVEAYLRDIGKWKE